MFPVEIFMCKMMKLQMIKLDEADTQDNNDMKVFMNQVYISPYCS